MNSRDTLQGAPSESQILKLETTGPYAEYNLAKDRGFSRGGPPPAGSLALSYTTHSHTPHTPTTLNYFQFHKYARLTLWLCT